MATTALLLPLAAVLLFFLHPATSATVSAPAPAPSAPLNITAILSNGAYSTFLRLLSSTQADTQITNQLNSSTEGMTLFAPTDNAFSALKPGTLNSLSAQQQVTLVQYHIVPKYYTWDTFETVSNPVNTQASGRTGTWGVNITTFGVQQVNVSTGVVQTQISNAIRLKFPLAVYQVEKVLLPDELFGKKAHEPVASPPKASAASSKANATADGPSSKDTSGASANGVVLGLVGGVFLGMVL